MKETQNADGCRKIILPNGTAVTLHYSKEAPSLQESMAKILTLHLSKTAKT